jgi:sulfite reductase (ferredoxin)
MTARYVAEKQPDETFVAFIKRIGKAACKSMLDDLTQVPPPEADPGLYIDWSDARSYSVGDIGIGECAGEIVSPVEFQLTAAEREAFEAQLLLEKDDTETAARLAYDAMHHAALALLRHQSAGLPDDPGSVVQRFREHFYDTQLFFDPFTGGKFAHYYFDAHEDRGRVYDVEKAHQLIEESQLFIEACHTCYAKLLQNPVAPAVAV